MTLELAYDAGFDPPAPVVTVLCEGPDGVVAPTRMLVDTGADCTVLPASMPRALGLPAVDSVRVGGVGGATRRATVYAAWLSLAGARLLVRVVGLGDEAILGRDVLAELVAHLDGPRARLRLARPARRAR